MKKKIFLAFSAVFLMFAAAFSGESVKVSPVRVEVGSWKKAPSSQWHIRMDTALAAAARENKKIFILTTGSDWCCWCNKLYNEVLETDVFRKFAAGNLILVYLDYPHKGQPESQKLYNELIPDAMGFSIGAPAATIIDKKGRVIGGIVGYKPLNDYMKEINRIMKIKKRTAAPPAWVGLPPAKLSGRLTALKSEKLAKARKARAATVKVKKNSKYRIVAWGLSEDEVNNPFYPQKQLQLPIKTRIYFKVKYQLPPGNPVSLWLSADSAYAHSQASFGEGKGEFIQFIEANRPGKEDKLQIIMRLSLDESPCVIAAELPCNIIWQQ